MSLKAALERVLVEWQTARNEEYARHPLATFIRDEVPREVEMALGNCRGFTIEGSAGRGRWAGVPWVAVFDDVVTDSATRGYYVVYLFHSAGTVVHLSQSRHNCDKDGVQSKYASGLDGPRLAYATAPS